MKFFGEVGYNTGTVESNPGVWTDEIVEYPLYGDVIRNSRKLDGETSVNPDISVGNSISVVADAYAREHFFAMRYVRWAGALWSIQNVDDQSPRLILRLGGVYNGPTAPAAPDPVVPG